MLTAEQKASVVAQYQTKPGDTGSPQVQIALLTQKIEALQGHFAEHKKDKHSLRGLLAWVEERKKLLKYLRNKDLEAYRRLVKELGLREGKVK